jgi:UDP-N-acetylglucosamine 2-epimerase
MVAKILAVFGTRPEAIKMLPVVKAIRGQPGFSLKVAVTGQHREMLDQVFSVFDERPDVDLNLMTPGQSLPVITSRILTGVTAVIEADRPDVVLVHGDTTTAFAAATAAFYAKCRIGHVEAGLRSFDLGRPWPEEFNRVAVDAIGDYLFAPTEAARENILKEYNSRGKIFVTGNTGIDALIRVAEQVSTDSALSARLSLKYMLDPARKLVLVTGHRRESFGEGFERICMGLRRLAERSDVEIVYPVHLNPSVRDVVLKRLNNRNNIRLIDPVDYLDMVFLMSRAFVILTDSGGIQEEGPALGRPVLVMRDLTERPEAVATGVVKLVGTDPDVIDREVSLLLDDEAVYRDRARPVFPYGNGTASREIVAQLMAELS